MKSKTAAESIGADKSKCGAENPNNRRSWPTSNWTASAKHKEGIKHNEGDTDVDDENIVSDGVLSGQVKQVSSPGLDSDVLVARKS